MENISYIEEIVYIEKQSGFAKWFNIKNLDIEGRIIRCSDESMPLKIYINPVIEGIDPEINLYFKRIVIDAMYEWKTASKNKITYQITDNKKIANILIIWDWKKENTYLFNKTMGFCKSQINTENKSLKKSTIKVYLNPDELFEKSKKIHITMLHELGHSLGLFNHSSDPEDIMYYAVNKIKPLSQRDKNSIKWLYKFPCGIKIKDIFLKYEKPETYNIDTLICELENNIDENCFSLI